MDKAFDQTILLLEIYLQITLTYILQIYFPIGYSLQIILKISLIFFFFFCCGRLFLVFIEFVTMLFWLFGPKACRILAPQPGIKPVPFALEDKVLTTEPKNTAVSFKLKIGKN